MSNDLLCLNADIKEVINKHISGNNIFCLIVQGDGMINARIEDGDLVFVRVQKSVNNGDIAVVRMDDKTMLSQVFYYPEKRQLLFRPANSKFETYLLEGEEIEQVQFLGKVVACLNYFELHDLMRIA